MNYGRSTCERLFDQLTGTLVKPNVKASPTHPLADQDDEVAWNRTGQADSCTPGYPDLTSGAALGPKAPTAVFVWVEVTRNAG